MRSLPSGSFEILDGVTRREDLAELGYSDSVPCLVTECTDEQALTLQCAFAFTRKNLDHIGFARYVKIKHDEGLTLSKIGEPFHLKKAQVSKYLALNKLSPEDKLRVAHRELSVDEAYALVCKRRLPQNFEPKVESKPCPWCGELVEDVWHAKTTLCPACEKRLTEAIKSERKFKQKKLDKVSSNKLLKL